MVNNAMVNSRNVNLLKTFAHFFVKWFTNEKICAKILMLRFMRGCAQNIIKRYYLDSDNGVCRDSPIISMLLVEGK
jgi:hypothetical protein